MKRSICSVITIIFILSSVCFVPCAGADIKSCTDSIESLTEMDNVSIGLEKGANVIYILKNGSMEIYDSAGEMVYSASEDFKASITSGKLTLFDEEHNRIAGESSSLDKKLAMGSYLLLVDNSGSNSYEKLSVSMD